MNKSIINTVTMRYPMQPYQVVQELGGGFTLPNEMYMPDGYAWVEPTGKPEFDQTTHRLVESTPIEVNGVWRQKWSKLLLTEEEIEQKLNEQKGLLYKQITDFRWMKESGGVTLPSGIKIASSREDQNRITSVISNAELASIESVNFKAASGWVTLTIPEIKAIAASVARHVQACFDNERVHHEAVFALTTLKDVFEYRYDTGWPS